VDWLAEAIPVAQQAALSVPERVVAAVGRTSRMPPIRFGARVLRLQGSPQ